MLILTDSQRFRVDLHQLCQRVHQPAADGNRTAHGHVFVRKLLAGHFGRGIDGRPILAHGKDLDRFRQPHAAHEILRFARSRSVADGNHFNLVFFHHRGKGRDGFNFLILWRMREDNLMMQQVPLGIQADRLAPIPESRVDGQRPFLSHRSGQQQLPQILPKNTDGFQIGLFLGFLQDFIRNRRSQQAVIGIVHGLADLLAQGSGRITPLVAENIVELIAAFLGIGIDFQIQIAFVGRAEHGQEVMRGYARERNGKIEIGPVFGRFRRGFSRLGHAGDNAARPIDAADGFAYRRAFAQAFGDNVPRSGERLFLIGHALLYIAAGFADRIGNLHLIHGIGQGLQTLFLGDRSPRTPLGTIRQVQILQPGGLNAGNDLLTQGIAQFSLLFDGSEDGLLPFFHLGKDVVPMPDLGHGHVVQSAGFFFPVPADEGNRVPLFKQVDTVFNLPGLHPDARCDMLDVQFFHIANLQN